MRTDHKKTCILSINPESEMGSIAEEVLVSTGNTVERVVPRGHLSSHSCRE